MVDDESVERGLLQARLQAEGRIVETYNSGEAFLSFYRAGSRGCLLANAWMPSMSGLELLQIINARGFGLPVIMTAARADIRLAVRAMKLGATTFLEKPIQFEELSESIDRALELTCRFPALSASRQAALALISELTSRERDVMELVVEGNPNKQIAYVLGVSQRTVETHRSAVMKKMGARSLAELVHMTISRSGNS